MSFIENTISEDHLLQGEELLDNGAVLEVVQIERKLWSVMVKDDGIIEVEIQNPNQKKQKSTCECKIFSKHKSCAHIAAALLHLRKLEAIKFEKKLKKEKERQKQKFNIRTILKSIDNDQLKKYVGTYAQRDRTFGIMLKASFAKSINLDDNFIKYRSLLDSLIKPVATERLKSNTSDLRLAMKVVDEFHSQMEDSISISAFEDAFVIIRATLPKLHYLCAKYPKNQEIASKWIEKFHYNIKLLYDEKLAPSFKTKIDDFILELSQKSYFNHLPNALSLFQILENNKRTNSKKKLIEYYSTLSISDVPENSQTVLGAIFIINNTYDQLQVNNDVKLKSVEYLLKTESVREAINYLEYFVKNEHRNRKMESCLLNAYDRYGMVAKFQKLAVDTFVMHEDFRYYTILKEKTPDAKWPKIKKEIDKAIKTHNPERKFLASYYQHEKMDDSLLQLLEDELDLRHIMKYDQYFYVDHYIHIERIYKKAITLYLDNHVGAIASNFIQEILSHLSRVRAYKLETTIKKFINSNYPHRASITTFS